MRAVQYRKYGGPDVLEMTDVDTPVVGPGEVLVDLQASGVNPFDWKLRAGHLSGFFKVEFPVTPGREGAGVVSGLGEGVTSFALGDEVCVMPRGVKSGTNAESVVVPLDQIVAKPTPIDFVAAAGFPVSGVTAWKALVEVAFVQPGMKVLVHAGAGGVGSLAIQLAKHLGAEVITTCSAANAEYARHLGADHVIAYDEVDFAGAMSGLDVVFDTMGGEVHRKSYEVLAPGGMLVYVIAGPVEDLAAEFGIKRQLAIVDKIGPAFTAMADLIARRIIVPQIGKVLPLADVRHAHEISQTGHARGKIVLTI
jgi:NADPH:quinone reductase-like Zn-dependent oxidoreductase